jgi:hypothetical protein
VFDTFLLVEQLAKKLIFREKMSLHVFFGKNSRQNEGNNPTERLLANPYIAFAKKRFK